MPQIDFGRAFETPDETRPASTPQVRAPLNSNATNQATTEPTRERDLRFGRSDWANIIFVIITVLGGLFCAFYFFNGAELMRRVAGWPKELLYGRPPEPAFA